VHHSCHERKAKDETQEPDALLTAIAKAPGMGRMTISGSAALPPSPEIVEREAALEATYAAEAAIRRQECDIALQRWRLMRKGLPMAAAHAVAVASIAAGAA